MNSLERVLDNWKFFEEVNPEDVPSMVQHLVGASDGKEEKNLLHLSKLVAKEKEAADFLRDVCEILGCLIETHPSSFTTKIMAIFAFCKTVFFVNPSAKARVQSLILLESLLRCKVTEDTAAQFEIAVLANQLRKQLTLSTNNSSTVLSQIRQLIGLMCQQFPVEMDVHRQDLMVSFVTEVQAALKSTSDKLDLTLLSGTIRGMSGIMMSYGIDEGDEDMLESVYNILRRVCKKPEDENGSVTRRGAMRSALDAFTDHCFLSPSFCRQISSTGTFCSKHGLSLRTEMITKLVGEH